MTDKTRDHHWRKPDRLQPAPTPYAGPIGPMVRELAVTYWARFGIWPETLTLTLAGAPVPPDLVREAEAARLLEQKRVEAEC